MSSKEYRIPAEHFRYKFHPQSSGLSPVVRFVPLGCSSRSPAKKATALRFTGTSQHKKTAVFLRCLFLIFTRSLPAFGGAITSTIPFHSASYVPLHSSRIMSVAPSFFGGCSFSQPSENKNTSLRKKNKKESKGKFRFQKVKFKPSGFLKKSPPLHFHNNSRLHKYFQFLKTIGVVFFQKNLTFFETSTNTTTFFFLFFCFENNFRLSSQRRYLNLYY